jgi:hypothetical protein
MNSDLLINGITQTNPNRLDVVLEYDQKKYPIFFESNGLSLFAGGEVVLPFTLVPMMVKNAQITNNNPVSKKMLEALPTFQDVYHTWLPDTKKIKLDDMPTEIRKPGLNKKRVGCFFSGGVDSWYTLLKNQDEITDLIYVHGFDVMLTDTSLNDQVLGMVNHIGEVFNKNVIVIKTNLRTFTDVKSNWHYVYGSALASVGHSLQEHFSKIFIASTHTYKDLYPAGSHPILDHLWNSETLSFVHDGCEAGRIDKLRLIATSEHAMKSLRVCWKNRFGPYNCCKCEKCIRTMISLQAIGQLDRCTTFNTELNLKDVRNILITDESMMAYTVENLDVLKQSPENRALYLAYKSAVNTSKWKVPLISKIDQYKKSMRIKHPSLMKVVTKVRHLGKEPKKNYWN